MFLLALGALGGLIALLIWNSRISDSARRASRKESDRSLMVYCAAGVKAPLDEAVRAFEKKTGIEILTEYAGSNTLLSGAEASRRGDLFIAADESYIDLGRKKGVIGQAIPLASIRPVLAVKVGNPRGIHSLNDLLRPGMKLAQANPDAAAIGKVTRGVLVRAGWWDKLLPHTAVFTGTVADVGNAVKLGTVDAGIVWDSTIRQTTGLEGIDLPVFSGVHSQIVAGVLTFSQRPDVAMQFARFLSSAGGGRESFIRRGYSAPIENR